MVIALAALLLIVLRGPGLSEVRDRLSDMSAAWIAAAIALEAASCASYVFLFRPVFCTRAPWRESWQIGLSEVAMGSLIPASGAGGVALGAWLLRRQGMPSERIGRRSVAFLLIKSSVNFVAVAVIGVLLAVGVLGPPLSLALTALPAALSVAVIAAILLIPRLPAPDDPGRSAGRLRRGVISGRRWIVRGTAEAGLLLRSGNMLLFAGAIGYWLFDNAVLWATYQGVGDAPPLSVVLMGYLIGQLGGLLPIPGGIGGIEGGLIGTLVVYGAAAAPTTAAVLAYRLILFWVPLVLGVPAFLTLWRRIGATAPA